MVATCIDMRYVPAVMDSGNFRVGRQSSVICPSQFMLLVQTESGPIEVDIAPFFKFNGRIRRLTEKERQAIRATMPEKIRLRKYSARAADRRMPRIVWFDAAPDDLNQWLVRMSPNTQGVAP